MATLNNLQTISSETISEETLNSNFSLLNEVALTGTNLSLNLIDTSTDPNPLIKLDVINDNFKKIKDNWINTSDATATASDIASGKTAYVNGQKITGNVPVTTSGVQYLASGIEKNSGYLHIKYVIGADRLFRNGSTVSLITPISNFGDATAADVASSKTFTSSAGLKITGTGALKQASDIVASKVIGNRISNYKGGVYTGWELNLDTPISDIKAFSVSAEYNNDSIDPTNGSGTIAGIYTQGTSHIGMTIEYIDGNNEWACSCYPITYRISSDGYTVTCTFGKSLGNIGFDVSDYGSVSGYVSGTYKA